MSKRTVECAAHGDMPPSYVCAHTRASLHDGKKRGFFWSRDDEGSVNAWCTECDNVLESVGGCWNDEAEAFAQIVLVCEGCALRVASLNGFDALE